MSVDTAQSGANQSSTSPLNTTSHEQSSSQQQPPPLSTPVFNLLNNPSAPLTLQPIVPPFQHQHGGDSNSQLGKRQYNEQGDNQQQPPMFFSMNPQANAGGHQYHQQLPQVSSNNNQQQGGDNGEQQERVVSPLLSPSRAATPPPPVSEQNAEEPAIQSMIPQQQPPQAEPPRIYSQLPLHPSSPERRGKRSKFNFNPERDLLLVQVIWQAQPWNSTQTLENTWQNVTNDFNDAANLIGSDGFKWKSCRDRFQTLAKQAQWVVDNHGPPNENSNELQKLLYQCNEEMKKAAEATSHVTKRRRSTKAGKKAEQEAAAAAAEATPPLPEAPPQVQEPEQEELANLNE